MAGRIGPETEAFEQDEGGQRMRVVLGEARARRAVSRLNNGGAAQARHSSCASRVDPSATAFEVRQALVASRAGRFFIWMTRACAVGLLLFVWTAWEKRKFELMLVHWLGGFFAFMLVRDLIAFRGLKGVESLANIPSFEPR